MMAGAFAAVFYGVGSWDGNPMVDPAEDIDEKKQESILKKYGVGIYEEPYYYESVCIYIPDTLQTTEGDTGFLGKQLPNICGHDEMLRKFVVEVLGEDPNKYKYGWWVIASPR